VRVARAKDWLIAATVLLLGRRRRRTPALSRPDEHRIIPPAPPDRRAENAVLLLLGLATLAAVAFVVVYALDRLTSQTQYLGLSLGLAFVFLAGACAVIAKKLVVSEVLVHDYPPPEHPAEQAELEQLVDESGERFTRKRLVLMAGAGAVGALGVALVTPAVSLGPVLDIDTFLRTPWHRGRRLVGEDGKPLTAEEIEEGSFYTAFPEHADPDLLASPLGLVRLRPAELRLPAGREGWAPQGILAYSKVCTHAGCAIALYRTPSFPAIEPKPALVCPCHYSTFDPATGGTVTFGPAGRALPQLPLAIDRRGDLRAAGTFNGPVGPSWWGVRLYKPK
jgi:ubiquinol-cytochrome c reductase iron-sulfur subunit